LSGNKLGDALTPTIPQHAPFRFYYGNYGSFNNQLGRRSGNQKVADAIESEGAIDSKIFARKEADAIGEEGFEFEENGCDQGFGLGAFSETFRLARVKPLSR
jgi:hypothetical protein